MPGAGELVIMTNPDGESSLRYLLRLPIAGGLVFRTAGTWPRTKALFCYPVPPEDWPEDGEVVERVPLRSCVRRGAAIEVVADRARENRSQLVFTRGRDRDMVFWQSPRTVKQARPNVALPTARAGGLADLEIIVDTRERYAYRFTGQSVTTVSRALPCGDYGVVAGDRLVAAVERKSIPDLVSSVTNGKLRYLLGDLAALPRAAVVVEDRYSALFKQRHARPAAVADTLAEYQVRWPTIPIVFCETRSLAEEWTYRYLAAAWQWAAAEPAAQDRTATTDPLLLSAPDRPEPTVAEVRAWARRAGLDVPDRGRLRPEIWAAWRTAQ
ncbi:MAG: ERCC4 domain-containing protein [Nocardioidaceae bacterium]